MSQMHDIARQLLNQQRQLTLPATLTLPGTDTNWSLQLQRTLRLLPGQRWVGAAVASRGEEEQPVLLKLFIGSKAQRHHKRELTGARRLQASGVATPALLAAGDWPIEASATGKFLIYQWLDADAASLQALQPLLPQFSQVIQTVAQLHEAQLLQTDMHLGNFLLQDDTAFAVDAGMIASLPSGAAGEQRALENLAVLFAQRYVGDALLELSQWVSAYQQARPDFAPAQHPGFGERMDRLTQTMRHRRTLRYLAKSVRECTEFAVVQKSGWRFVRVRGQDEAAYTQFSLDPESVMATGELLKGGNTATVVRTQLAGESVVIKRYNIKSTRHRVAQSLRPTGRALRAWRNALRLQFLGVATAAPLALLETWQGPLRSTAYLVLQDVGKQDLLQALSTPADLNQWLPPLVELMVTLKRAGFVHGDTKATNFMVADNRLYLIDVDSLSDVNNRVGHWRPHPGFAKDQARLLKNWADQPQILEPLSKALSQALATP